MFGGNLWDQLNSLTAKRPIAVCTEPPNQDYSGGDHLGDHIVDVEGNQQERENHKINDKADGSDYHEADEGRCMGSRMRKRVAIVV